jgi:hypothetical protein
VAARALSLEDDPARCDVVTVRIHFGERLLAAPDRERREGEEGEKTWSETQGSKFSLRADRTSRVQIFLS